MVLECNFSHLISIGDKNHRAQFPNRVEILGYFSHQGRLFWPIFPVWWGSHRVCDTGVYNATQLQIVFLNSVANSQPLPLFPGQVFNHSVDIGLPSPPVKMCKKRNTEKILNYGIRAFYLLQNCRHTVKSPSIIIRIFL